MARDCGRRTWTGRGSEISADRALAPLLEEGSHSRRRAGNSRGGHSVPAVSSSWTHSDRLAGCLCANFPLQWPGVCDSRSSGASTLASRAGSAGRTSYCGEAQEHTARMVTGRICLANGSISFVRTGCVPLVPSLAAAIFDFGLDPAVHPLDCKHHPHLRPVAFAYTGASVGRTAWMGDAARIRMLGIGCCNDRLAPDPAVARSPML